MRNTFLLAIVSLIMLTTGTAMGESLKGRFGIYGKGGVTVPLKDDFVSGSSDANVGVATGGGIIFGFTKNLAAEIDVTYAPSIDVEYNGEKTYEAKFTDYAIGLQYRGDYGRFAPYIGIGADFLRGHNKFVGAGGATYTLDWTEGGHANLGVDYFITRGIVFTLEGRGIYAARGDWKRGDTKVGKWDPTSFIGTAGIRLILPEVASW